MSLAKARAAKERQRRQEARKVVRDYERWLKAGSPTKKIPPIPTDAQWRVVHPDR